MNDPNEYLCCIAIAALVLGAWVAIRECANATLQGNRNWWKRACYRAQQRQEYREFSKQLDEVDDLERMGAE